MISQLHFSCYGFTPEWRQRKKVSHLVFGDSGHGIEGNSGFFYRRFPSEAFWRSSAGIGETALESRLNKMRGTKSFRANPKPQRWKKRKEKGKIGAKRILVGLLAAFGKSAVAKRNQQAASSSCAAAAEMSKQIRKVSEDMLFVSEPSPFMFGNGMNTPDNPHWTNGNWLKSRFHFSFAEYRNPKNSRFSSLRVLNDDLVQPSRGFGAHPHANMEIFTYIVEGELSHKDSNGNAESLGRHSVQFMSAGDGVVHSEFNDSKEKAVRFLQLWITPRDYNIPSNYGSFTGDERMLKNKWQHLVSDSKSSKKTPIKLCQDVSIYATLLDEGKNLDFHIADDRQAYLVCVEGVVTVDGGGAKTELQRHDAAEIFGDVKLNLIAEAPGTHLLIVDLKKDESSRF